MGAFYGGQMSSENIPASRIDVDVPIPALLPGRMLHITAIAVLPAYDVVRIEYEVMPPMEPIDWEADTATYEAWARRNDWLLTGRDDQGVDYDDWGGARGLAPDGEKTRGERDLRPAPPPGATWLEIAFHAAGYPPDSDHASYALRLTLPLNADSCHLSAKNAMQEWIGNQK